MTVTETGGINPWDRLANAIVESAATDYKIAYRDRLIGQKYNDSEMIRQSYGKLKSLDNFFNGEWIKTLTKLDGRYITLKIRRGVEEFLKKSEEVLIEPKESKNAFTCPMCGFKVQVNYQPARRIWATHCSCCKLSYLKGEKYYADR